MIYFDNNATTRLAPEVLDAMTSVLAENFGNPSSAHAAGRSAKYVVENARDEVAGFLGARSSDEIIFTASGTEADNWAINGVLEAAAGKDHLITTRVEHEAVRKVFEALERRGYLVTWLDVDEHGLLDLDALRSSLTDQTALVSVMLANNETGMIFPVGEIGQIIKERSDAIFHVDGINAVGKIPFDVGSTEIDLLSIAAHKFYGPKGIGALYIRDGVRLSPVLTGGNQERGMRAGTEAVHQIAGMGVAARVASASLPLDRIQAMRDRLETAILDGVPRSFLNGSPDTRLRLPNTSSISFENANGEMIMARLDAHGICVSTGSACHSQGSAASSVLSAMNIPYSRAMGSIRFSLGRYNTEDEVDRVLDVLPGIVADVRAIAGES